MKFCGSVHRNWKKTKSWAKNAESYEIRTHCDRF